MDVMKMLDGLEELVRGNREAERLVEDVRNAFVSMEEDREGRDRALAMWLMDAPK